MIPTMTCRVRVCEGCQVRVVTMILCQVRVIPPHGIFCVLWGFLGIIINTHYIGLTQRLQSVFSEHDCFQSRLSDKVVIRNHLSEKRYIGNILGYRMLQLDDPKKIKLLTNNPCSDPHCLCGLLFQALQPCDKFTS